VGREKEDRNEKLGEGKEEVGVEEDEGVEQGKAG
jgi:hypothetical protein